MNEPTARAGPDGTATIGYAVPWILAAISAALRLPRLDLRPLHHDEGTNVIFLLRLIREGTYHYDPSNYHGPLLYFLSAVPLLVAGTTTVALRAVPALLGSALAPMVWGLRRDIGRAGALAGGLLLAVSPSLVYYSRDNIHEIYLVFLTLALLMALRRAVRDGGAGWYAAAGLAAGAMVATKETAVLAFLCLGAAALVSGGGRPTRPRYRDAAVFLGCAGVLVVALYSDLFRDARTLLGPFEALRLWTVRGVHADGHGKPWWYFPAILAREEPAALAGAALGAIAAVRRRRRFTIFLGIWSGAAIAGYSLIPYKTPWLVLNMVLPLALWAGAGFDDLFARGQGARIGGRVGALAALLLSVGAMVEVHRAWFVSFVRYDDDGASRLVYVQTRREALDLVARIEAYAAAHPDGRSLSIEILSPDYLPLNWYLRDFPNVGYFGVLIDRPGAPIVIARADEAATVAGRLGEGYGRALYPLRPGVDLVVFFRETEARSAPATGPGPSPGRGRLSPAREHG